MLIKFQINLKSSKNKVISDTIKEVKFKSKLVLKMETCC